MPLKKNQGSRHLQCETLESRYVLTVVISEFLAENDRGIEDAAGHEHDWVELHNTGGSTEDISGWFLSDNAGELTKWEIPTTPETTSFAPGERLLIFASGDGAEVGVVGDELHANFQLSQEPGYLGLTKSNGTTVEHEYNLYPQQTSDFSYGIGIDVATYSTASETLVGDSTALKAIVPQGLTQAETIIGESKATTPLAGCLVPDRLVGILTGQALI